MLSCWRLLRNIFRNVKDELKMDEPGTIDNKERIKSSQDNLQLEKMNENILHNQNISEDIVFEYGKQYSTILKRCKNIHIGPKVINNNYLPAECDSPRKEMSSNKKFLKYKERLKYRYVTNYAYMRSFFWEGKRNDFLIKNHFVDLTVEKADLFGKKEGEAVSLQEMFSKENEGHYTILVTGGPGYGKTTFCKKIAYDWGADEQSTNYLAQFDFVVVILLRELGEKTLYDSVLYNIFQNEKDDLKDMLEENVNILVLLDGFDEIIDKSSVLNFIRDESFDISLQMTILVTSRPQVTEEIREDMKLRFSLDGFSEEQKQRYIGLVFKEDKERKENLIRILRENIFYYRLTKCPLMLHMLCFLHQNGEIGKKEGKTSLYIRIFVLIIERYLRKNGNNENFSEGEYFKGEDLLLRLGNLFHHNYKISSKDLKKHFPIDEEYNFIIGIDILQFYSYSADTSIWYECVHQSFLEFLQALHIYKSNRYFNYIINDDTLIFLLGLFGKKLFPKKFKRYLWNQMFNVSFMIRAYKEIDLEENRELFFSKPCVNFFYHQLNDLKLLLSIYNLTELYFCFDVSKREYKSLRDDLIEFFKNYDRLNKILIKVYILFKDDIYDNQNIKTLYETAPCLFNFFQEIRSIRHNMCLWGILHLKNNRFSSDVNLSLPTNVLEINADGNEFNEILTKSSEMRTAKSKESYFNCFFVPEKRYNSLYARKPKAPHKSFKSLMYGSHAIELFQSRLLSFQNFSAEFGNSTTDITLYEIEPSF